MCDSSMCDQNYTCCGCDLCGLICSGIAWITLSTVSYTIWFHLGPVPSWLMIFFSITVTMAFISHCVVMSANPGFLAQGTHREEWIKESSALEDQYRREQIEKREKLIQDNEAILNNIEGSASKRKRTVISDKEIEFRVKRSLDKHRRNVRYCAICEIYKPPSAHHCSVCKRCVRRMDHHCPWVNTCVAEYNLKYFLQFLMYVAISSIAGIGIFAYRIYMSIYGPETIMSKTQTGSEEAVTIVLGSISFVLCVFFCVFVVAMGMEQYEAVTSGIPGIDSMQDIGEDENLSICDGTRKYGCFNERFGWRWFVPIPGKLHHKQKEE